MKPAVLVEIAKHVSARIKERKEKISFEEIQRKSATSGRICLDFQAAIVQRPFSTIAEIKYQSPSGSKAHYSLLANKNPVQIAKGYATHGASAISILTESDYFAGSLEYLIQVREALPEMPLLMKDFVVEEYQLYEAKVYGADVVLLIAALLEPNQIQRFLEISKSLGLSAIVEVHGREELHLAHQLGAPVIGVNNRDLKTLKIDLEISRKLAREFSPSHLYICESGLSQRQELEEFSRLGFHGFLVGSSLMKSPDPGSQLQKLLESKNGSIGESIE